jgi:hypothetical protein
MGVFAGVEKTWASQTNTGRTHIATKGIVQSGLVLNLDAGVSSSYPGSGTTWTDLSGNGNNGTLTNGPTYNSANGGSIVFDGSNDYVTIPYDTSFNSSKITVDCVTRVNSKIHVRPIVNRWANSWRLLIVNVGFYRFQFDILVANQVYTVRSNFVFDTSSIYHITATYDGTSLKMYINGNLQDDLLVSGNLDSSSNDIKIARNSSYNPSRHLNQNFYNLKIYNRALSAAEIQQNYNALRSRFGI